jgi:peptide/nickel transport system permease protein
MGRYIIRRSIQAVGMLFVMSIVFFGLIHAIPGGPQTVFFNPRLPADVRINLAHQLGIDQPLPIQYWNWLKAMLQGNFGTSFTDHQPVISDVGARVPATLELFLAAFSFALLVAILLGVFSAVRQYSLTDYVVTVLAYFGIAMPVFFFGLVLQEIFAVKLGLLPDINQHSLDQTGFTPLEVFEDYAVHLVLPVLMFSLLFIAVWSRYLRSSMLDVVKQDYIRTARAKGLSTRTVFFRHALRNALIPLITQVAIDFGGIAAGAVITESIFAWAGLGQLFLSSLENRDYPTIMAMLLLITAAVIVANLIADILYGVVDPRIRYS